MLYAQDNCNVTPPPSILFTPNPLIFALYKITMNHKFVERISSEMDEIRSAGLYKSERIITSAQGPEIEVNGKKVLNFCANNYLGLSSHPKVMEAARKYVDSRGYGLSSVRFICGTQDIHKELEAKISFPGNRRHHSLCRCL